MPLLRADHRRGRRFPGALGKASVSRGAAAGSGAGNDGQRCPTQAGCRMLSVLKKKKAQSEGRESRKAQAAGEPRIFALRPLRNAFALFAVKSFNRKGRKEPQSRKESPDQKALPPPPPKPPPEPIHRRLQSLNHSNSSAARRRTPGAYPTPCCASNWKRRRD